MSWNYFDLATMFFSSFTLVFLLGFQSKNVQSSRYWAAIGTSFGISLANFMFVKFAATGGLLPFAICAAGGCIGIAASIWVGDNVFRKRTESINGGSGKHCHCHKHENATKAVCGGRNEV